MGTSEPSPAVTLTPSQPGGRQPGGANDQPSRSLAVSQARLNEIVAPIIRGASVDRDLIARALDALREHNWASGFAFEGTSAPGWPRLSTSSRTPPSGLPRSASATPRARA